MTQPHDTDPAARYGEAMRSDASRERDRQRRRYETRRGPGTWIWWAVAVGGLVLFALLMWGVMEKTKWTAGDVARDAAAAAPRAVTAAA
ncbi:hypothetical protein DWG18_07235 [Lysobacter sp. TY2-98]|uniref:hypothetical protein n=1 Tax=Lysobacter sp. TY2-98 TaxID=2290922 RepID=UPI000E208D8E|nr:hypothetical protein [Lysobacter sp. TY2-98]AXK72094.1 hypothetical protein DWG18_07235 [Lysobacter sp. TY2-98]